MVGCNSSEYCRAKTSPVIGASAKSATCLRNFPALTAMTIKIYRCLFLFFFLSTSRSQSQNHVIDLDGEGDNIRLSLYKTNNINEFTIEIWANWHKFGVSSTCIEISRQSQTLGIGASFPHWTAEGVPNLEFYAFDERKAKHVISIPNITSVRPF